MAAENTEYGNDIRLRISPRSGKIVVEELKRDGAVSFKEISPIDLYFMLNESYRSSETVETGFLPAHCLSASIGKAEKTFVLWNPELRADMTYRDVEYPGFPIPRLVFGIRLLDTGRVAGCTLGVVADEKPTPASLMYHYPFSNVYEDSRVCTGNNVLPRYKKQAALVNFPRYLLGIPDNDDMFSPERNKLRLGHKELMEHLKDKEPAYYYTDVLIPNGKTLGDFIGGIYGRNEEDDE